MKKVMSRTKMDLEIAPHSQIDTFQLCKMLNLWGEVAGVLEEMIQPNGEEVIVWRLEYLFRSPTREEWEEAESLPVTCPFIVGTVALYSPTLIRRCEAEISLSINLIIHASLRGERVFGEDVPKFIAKMLR